MKKNANNSKIKQREKNVIKVYLKSCLKAFKLCKSVNLKSKGIKITYYCLSFQWHFSRWVVCSLFHHHFHPPHPLNTAICTKWHQYAVLNEKAHYVYMFIFEYHSRPQHLLITMEYHSHPYYDKAHNELKWSVYNNIVFQATHIPYRQIQHSVHHNGPCISLLVNRTQDTHKKISYQQHLLIKLSPRVENYIYTHTQK